MHSLLKRQIKRFLNDAPLPQEGWDDFINAVDSAYVASDTDREMLERSMELSSHELLKMNSEMRAIFQDIPDLLFRTEDTGTILDYKAGSMTGFLVKPETLIGKKIQDIPDKIVGLEFRNALDIVKSTKKVHSFEYVLQISDKKEYFEARVIPIPQNQMIVMIRNITESKLVQEELERTRALLFSAITQTPAGILIADAPNGTIRVANQAALDFRGKTNAPLIGIPLEEHAKYWKMYLPDGTTLYPARELPLSRAILEGEISTYVELIIKDDNDNVRWLSANAGPVRDKEGKIAAGIVVFTDITHRKEAEKSLRESEDLYRTIFENTGAATIIIEEDTIISLANEEWEKLSGYTREECEWKMSWQHFVHPDDVQRMRSYHDERRIDGQQAPRKYEFRYIRRNGEMRYMINSVSVIPGTLRSVASMIDITDLKQAEVNLIRAKERAEEASRVKSNFLANMSHELRTPLIGILGFAEILGYELKDPELHRMTDTIFHSGQRLSKTLNLILDLSKVEANKLELKMQKLNINKAVQNAVALFSLSADQKKLTLKANLPGAPLFANVDEHLLEEILYNLINNAIKYTEKGAITIRVEQETIERESYVKIVVSDTGIGIPKGDLQLIFEEFRQVSEGFNRRFEGTGLGLTITKRITELMGGTIEVQSEINKGSQFTVRFPAIMD